jgi:4-hydroxyacetophenone monooxygenase
VPSQWYSYSFEVEYPWKHAFATQPEIKTYLAHCMDKYAVRDQVRFGTEVVAARWSDADGLWHVNVRCGGRDEQLQANAIISAVGMLNRPLLPEIDGLDDFSGRIFHTSRWDDSFDLEGKRVCLIGTGASGMQLGPRIASQVESLVIFQRSPSWVFPVPGYREPLTPEIAWLCKHLPYYRQWLRFRISHAFGDRIHDFFWIDPDWKDSSALNRGNAFLRDRCIEHLRRELEGRPDLIWKCVPDYPPMVKRFVVDNGWYAALRRQHVELVTDPISEITRTGIATRGGREYPADLIVLATGFQANRHLWPMEIWGRNETRLEDAWSADGPRAYLGITMPGFPNFFCLYGPNTNPRQGGVCTMLECQVRYALGCIRALIEGNARSLECRREVHDAFNKKLDALLSSTIWMHETQNSYYMNRAGRVATNSPWRLLDYWRWTREPNPDDFLIR